MKKDIEKLNKLTQLHAIASNEVEVTSYLKSSLKGQITKDRLGSVVASTGEGGQVLITAPIDEVGMIVTQVTKQGLLKFQNVGFIHAKNSINQLFLVTTKDKTFLATLIGKPLTYQAGEELSKVEDFKSLYLDAGFKSDKEAFDKGIQIGDMVTRYAEFKSLENDRFISKALDTRSSVYVLSELLEEVENLKVALNAAFTVQNKMNMKGAKTASYMIEPELAISLDTMESTDHTIPDFIKLGGGPVISFYDQGLIAHPKLRNYVLNLCKLNEIPYQEAHQQSVISEGHYLQLSKLGAATLSIGIPIKNKHSHHQMIDYSDLVHTKKLLKLFVESLNDKIIDKILYT